MNTSILNKVLEFRNRPTSPLVYGAAICIFLGFGLLAVRSFPWDEVEDPSLLPALLLLGVAIPINILLNAGEYQLQSRLTGVDINLLAAARVSLLASASNLLPIPGSVLVRTAALSQAAGAAKATKSSLATGAMWLACTLVPVGITLVAIADPLFGTALTALGLILAAVGIRLIVKLDPSRPADIVARFVVLESATVLIGGIRLWLSLAALGYSVAFSRMIPLTLAGASASASGFFPAGLGVREALSAGLASLMDLPASVGFVAAATDSLASIAVIAVAGLAVAHFSSAADSEQVDVLE